MIACATRLLSTWGACIPRLRRQIGKLTVATKVFRGIAGLALPDEFWRPNDYGVKGGVEGAFMSTTTDRRVAMQYAASGGTGFIFEVQQVPSYMRCTCLAQRRFREKECSQRRSCRRE